MSWYLKVLKKYADFGGRARRKEYWLFILWNIFFFIALIAIEAAAGGAGILASLYNLGMIIPSLAVTVRRLHDTNRSGWYTLVALVPLVGFFVLLFFMSRDSDPGTNQYGSNPKV